MPGACRAGDEQGNGVLEIIVRNTGQDNGETPTVSCCLCFQMSERLLNFFFQICLTAPGLELSGLTESHACLIQKNYYCTFSKKYMHHAFRVQFLFKSSAEKDIRILRLLSK